MGISREEVELSLYHKKWCIENNKNTEQFKQHLKVALRASDYLLPQDFFDNLHFHKVDKTFIKSMMNVGYSFRQASRYRVGSLATINKYKKTGKEVTTEIDERYYYNFRTAWLDLKQRVESEGFTLI